MPLTTLGIKNVFFLLSIKDIHTTAVRLLVIPMVISGVPSMLIMEKKWKGLENGHGVIQKMLGLVIENAKFHSITKTTSTTIALELIIQQIGVILKKKVDHGEIVNYVEAAILVGLEMVTVMILKTLELVAMMEVIVAVAMSINNTAKNAGAKNSCF